MEKIKNNKRIVILIFIFLLFMLILAFVLKNYEGSSPVVDSQIENTGQSLIIDDSKTMHISENRESVFLKQGSVKQKKADGEVKGGSQTHGVKEISDTTGSDAGDAAEDIFLPGIW